MSEFMKVKLIIPSFEVSIIDDENIGNYLFEYHSNVTKKYIVDGKLKYSDLLLDGKEIKSYKIDKEKGIITLMLSRYPWHICPRCLKSYVGYPTLSRRDKKTKICPMCSKIEAFEDKEKVC